MNGTPAPLHVLIVVDSDDAAETTAALIRLWGHAVRIAASGEDALLAAAERMPDLVVLDLGLPRMTGHEVARQLRGLSAGPPFIIALTAQGSQREKNESAAMGIDAYFVKPADPAALRELIDRVQAAKSSR